MTIETSPANNLFAGFNAQEKQMLGVAIRRVDELEETRRIMAGMSVQAQGIETDLKVRGVTDADTLREAAEAVAATRSTQGALASEVQDYRKLFGPDGKAAAAVGQYVQLLRTAHAGDVNALNRVQGARRELYEARDAAAQQRDPNQIEQAQPNEITRSAPERTRPVQPNRTEDGKQRLLNPEASTLRHDLATALPTDFVGRYVRDGNKLVDANDAKHVVLIDRGAKLQVPREFGAESVKAAVDVAHARGWSTLNVAGDPKFRQALWVEAASRGIEVKGYSPSQGEQEWATKTAERAGKTNVVSENQAVRAFQEAKTPAERSQAAAAHPELKKAFAVEANFAAVAKQLHTKNSQDAFMKRMRENIAIDLAQGREMADIRLRKPMFQEQSQARSADRDRGR